MTAAGHLEARLALAECYRLLSRLYRSPDQGLLSDAEGLATCSLIACPEASKFAQLMVRDLDKADSTDELMIDHARLFVGPFRLLAPPYGSVYLEGNRQVLGDSTLAVQEIYRQSGLDLSQSFQDAPDHISAELEFIYYLLFKEIRAAQNGGQAEAETFSQTRASFFEEYLWPWVVPFTGAVTANATTAFYRDLARTTHHLLAGGMDSAMA